MATSGTTSFSVTRNDIIFASLRLLGVLEEGAVANPTAIENASLVLNMLIKDWMTDGIKLWTTTEIVLPLVAGQTSYSIGSDNTNDLVTHKPLRLIQAFLRNLSVDPFIDMPMTLISEQEYNILGSKFSEGAVNSVYYKPYVNHGIAKVFLTPNTSTATNYELHLNVQRPIEDISGANQTFDFPSEWYQSLRWGLASELASEYGLTTERIAAIISRANSYKDRLAAWDTEYNSTFFQPDVRMNQHAYR
jgi:hypothetical protein